MFMKISAKVIADSVCNDVRITTFEVEFPRIILAEFNTHRMFSRNTSSTRAIPLKKLLENPSLLSYEPNPFTVNKPGMASNEPISEDNAAMAAWFWRNARVRCIDMVAKLAELGVAKQHAGRLFEPFMYVKVVVTATEWRNFFWLRDHEAAQPEIQTLARRMKEAYDASTPKTLHQGWWHVPYFQQGYWSPSHMDEDTSPADTATLEEALLISVSCCAQASYRTLDDTLEKAQRVYDRLLKGDRVHASPFEHQATPIKPCEDWSEEEDAEWPDGITHIDRIGNAWSGNFREWIQYRQLIPGHVVM
jgi:thymidylate synthase ThyX